MNEFISFLNNSYTAYQAVENAQAILEKAGFQELKETESWNLSEGGKYFTVRGGSALIAFTIGKGNSYKIVASHTDSPCFKLKENPVLSDENYTRLNTEPYGGGLYYTFFDRPLKLAGRAVYRTDEGLICKNLVSDFTVVIPSLAIHMNRDANEKFSPNPQTDALPLLGVGKKELNALLGDYVSADLFAVCAEPAFTCGADGELLSSPRIDNLSSAYSSVKALIETAGAGVCMAALFDSEEVGSRTRQGAGSDFLSAVCRRISMARGLNEEEHLKALSSSFLISLDNAHALHPNHPEKCDLTNRAKLGGGVVIKGHAGGAYTTDALSSAVIKTIFERAGVKYQAFYNRSDMRSGSTLGAISLGQVSVPSCDLGIAQLAMHSAVETMATEDFYEVEKGLKAFYSTALTITHNGANL